MRGALPIAVTDGWDAEGWAVAQVETAPAPALVARADGTLVAANAYADLLIAGQAPAPSLKALIADASRIDKMQVVRLALQGSEAGTHVRRFDISLLPLPDALVLVVAREVTLEANLIGALTASRELFRDLIACATDFAFETDASGVFSWVSGGGALGYSATELHGSHPLRMFGDVEGIKKFSSREAVSGDEIWCTSKDGSDCCVALTVVPVKDAEGRWRAARGVARDVTALRLHEREAETARRREELIAAIVGAVRGQIEPRRMLLAAAEALLVATQSDCVTIRPTRLAVSASIGETRGNAPHSLDRTTSYQNRTNGTVQLLRNGDQPCYGKAETSLLEAVVPHLGIAFALVESFAPVASKAMLDAATDLPSRDGFEEKGRRRLGALARAGQSCAVIVLESAGEACGADHMRAVGHLLAARIKAPGIAARLTDASFALLIDADSAAQVPENVATLIDDCAALGALAGAEPDMKFCAGASFCEAQADIPLDDHLARASIALAQAKRERRQCVVSSEPMKKVMPC